MDAEEKFVGQSVPIFERLAIWRASVVCTRLSEVKALHHVYFRQLLGVTKISQATLPSEIC